MNEYITVVVSLGKAVKDSGGRVLIQGVQLNMDVSVAGWGPVAMEVVDVPEEGSDMLYLFARFRPNMP